MVGLNLTKISCDTQIDIPDFKNIKIYAFITESSKDLYSILDLEPGIWIKK
jgi:hypothetical protein